MATRAGIAAALSTVADVTGYAYRPSTPLPGDGWPLLTGYERADGMAFFALQRVLVLLPQAEVDASAWIDAHVDALVEALEPLGYVERIDPVNLAAGTGEQYGLQITLRGE